ncbi:MAG TPA: hypothetical protein VK588_10240 [Chitinophagaceae bacterium]|nr:hypothetical protein [Chitinophagaceae bacterium]
MNAVLPEIFSLSILIAAVIAIFRSGNSDNIYYPFFALIWIATLNEILSIILVNSGSGVNINNNIYVLAESLIILWFFKKVGTVLSNYLVFLIISISFILFWVTENFIISKITFISSYFRIYYSFVIVILSITTVNHLIVTQNKLLLKLPVFLISVGFIIYFTYKILVEAFWIYGLNDSPDFRSNVYAILVWLNLFVNLLFALAILWIPRKREYILLF